MKRGVLKFTACCLAAGMTLGGTGTVAFASKDTELAGIHTYAEDSQEETAAEQTDNAGSTDSSADTEAAAETESTEAAAADNTETETAETAAAENTETETAETAAADNTEAETAETEAAVDTSLNGTQAFAQCDEYINVRSGADTNSEVVGKVYNNGSVTILSQTGDWYEVQSGNVTGYVKAEYFATGAEAEAIAEEVGYNVATVHPEALMIRSEPSEDSEAIGMAESSDQLEVVAYEGDWMKVALDADTYGYVNAYYVSYDTYYSTAETLEEEQARLDQQWLDYLAEQEAEQQAAEEAYLAAIAEQEAQAAAAEQAAADAAAQAAAEQQAAADQAAADQAAAQQQAEYEAQVTADAQAQADAAYQEYLDAQAAADAATQQADEQAVADTAAQAQAEYQEYLDAQAAADAQAQAEADAAAQAQAAAEQAAAEQAAAEQAAAEQAAAEQAAAEQAAAEQAAAEQAAAEQAATEQAASEDTSYTDTSASSSLGQEIANYALQFVGNPYVWGGTSLTNGADCSGFTQSVFANFGIGIPRTAASQSGSGTPVSLDSLQAGDLIFYGDGGISHVALYIGGGQVVHASSSTTGIIVSSYNYRTPVSASRYW